MSLQGTERVDRKTLKDFLSDCSPWLTGDIEGALERTDQVFEDLSKARDRIAELEAAVQPSTPNPTE